MVQSQICTADRQPLITKAIKPICRTEIDYIQILFTLPEFFAIRKLNFIKPMAMAYDFIDRSLW